MERSREREVQERNGEDGGGGGGGCTEGRVYYHAIACISTQPEDEAVKYLISDKFI